MGTMPLRALRGALLALVLLHLAAGTLLGIPALYPVTCTLGHRPFPRLSAFGEEFAGNGFELAVAEAPRDTLATGDPLLRLGMTIPLAIRVDAYVSALANEADGSRPRISRHPTGSSS